MIIPIDKIDFATLEAIAQEFITREGTDYGALELSLEDKVAALLAQVRGGQVLIVFDERSETVNLVNKDDYVEQGAT